MKPFLSFSVIALALTLTACQRTAPADTPAQPRVAVTLTHATLGTITEQAEYSATTAYLQKSVISAPLPSFILSSSVSVGSRVRAGQTLFRLQSQEQQALGSDVAGAPLAVTSSRSGIVLEMAQQPGNFVPQGAPLCTLAEAGSLVFEINVPYEDRQLARPGTVCLIILPDGTRLRATVAAPLATMNTEAQAEQVIAWARAPFLPEGLNARAVFTRPSAAHGRSLLLPRSAVQCDETLTRHWVMVMASATTVRRVAVTVGNANDSLVEVSGPLTTADRVVLTGGYGLDDGAVVRVTR